MACLLYTNSRGAIEPRDPNSAYLQARASGAKTYETGEPCCRGHVGPRRTCNRQCLECEAQYSVDWRTTNIERVRELERARYHVAPDKQRGRKREWYSANKETEALRRKAYWLADPSKPRASCAAWRAKNPGAAAAATKRWMALNREVCRVYARKRRAKLMSSVGHHTADEIRGLMLWQRGRCAYCKTNIKKKYHADHIIPLILGGSDLIGNIQLTCATCNHKKGGKHPVDFARYIGRLL
jgi:5-methylcytosine-specific restriction endonuclease McrA